MLLDTTVPDRLLLPPIDVDATFGADLVDRAERFERFLRWSFVLSQVVLVVTLTIFARNGVALMRESAAGRIGTGMLLGMLGLAIVWLVQLPFGLADLWWARRHDVTELGYLEWALSGWVELGVVFLSICLSLMIVMAIAGPLGDHWWLPGSLVFVAIGGALAFTSPYLLQAGTVTDRLDDPALAAAAREYAREQGVDEIPMYVEEVSTYTDQANAYAAGFGPTRRVVLWDTLLLDFEENEVKVVVAHEIGSPLEQSHPGGDGVVRLAGDSRRVHRRAGDAPPRWDEEPGGRAARAADGRRVEPARASPDELGQPADGDGGGLEGAPVERAPGGDAEPVQGVRRGIARRPVTAVVGPRAARHAPDARAARRVRRGLEVVPLTSARGTACRFAELRAWRGVTQDRVWRRCPHETEVAA